jgi:hypothetical protein
VWVPATATTWSRVALVPPQLGDGTNAGSATTAAIDDANVVSGKAEDGTLERAVRWTYSEGNWSQGAFLNGGVGSWAVGASTGAISGGVWITYNSGASCEQRMGALWINGSADPILVSVPNDANAMWVMNDVNDARDVVGRTKGMCASSGLPAWLNSAGATTSLPLPKGTTSGEALAVSNRGSVTRAVGYAGNVAVLWNLP